MGDFVGHPFRGNQYSEGGVSVSRGDWRVREPYDPYARPKHEGRALNRMHGRANFENTKGQRPEVMYKTNIGRHEFDAALDYVVKAHNELVAGDVLIEYGSIKGTSAAGLYKEDKDTSGRYRPTVRIRATRNSSVDVYVDYLVHELTHAAQHRAQRADEDWAGAYRNRKVEIEAGEAGRRAARLYLARKKVS